MRRMQADREEFVGRLLATYRSLLGDFEPSPAFVGMVWRTIEARHAEGSGWASYLVAWAPRLAYASAAAAALLIVSQWVSAESGREALVIDSAYVDVLAMNSVDEQDGALWMSVANRR